MDVSVDQSRENDMRCDVVVVRDVFLRFRRELGGGEPGGIDVEDFAALRVKDEAPGRGIRGVWVEQACGCQEDERRRAFGKGRETVGVVIVLHAVVVVVGIHRDVVCV